MYRFRIMHCIIICLFMSVFCVLAPVFAAESSMENVLPRVNVRGWIMKDKKALFTKETLSDHINGEAELYFPYGFDLAATAAYVNSKNPEVWMVLMCTGWPRCWMHLELFQLSKGRCRRSDGWCRGVSFCFPVDVLSGRYFVRIQVTGTTDLREDTFLTCGRAISRNLPPHTGLSPRT